jgi:hypothetical protein
VEGYDDHETDSDDGNKHKESSTPLWKYVTKLGGWKAGGTEKFICSQNNLHRFIYPCEKASMWDYAMG